MPRNREKWPLQVTADKAIKIVTKLYNSYGKTVNADLVAPLLECSRKSSNFSKRLSALGDFGLVTYGRDIVSLTPLGERIAAPVSETERNRAVMEAFNNVDLLKSLLDRFPGGHLPARESIKNLLMREYNVPRETVHYWCDFVEQSFQVIPDKVGQFETTPSMPDVEVKEAQAPLMNRWDANPSQDLMKIPLSGSRFLLIPNDMTREENEYFEKWFELWKTLSDANK